MARDHQGSDWTNLGEYLVSNTTTEFQRELASYISSKKPWS